MIVFRDYKKETIDMAINIIKEQILTDTGEICGYIDINEEECENFIAAIQYLIDVNDILQQLNERANNRADFLSKEVKTQDELAKKIAKELFEKLNQGNIND